MKKVLIRQNRIREIYVTSEGKIEWLNTKSGKINRSYRGILASPNKKSVDDRYLYYSISLRDEDGNQHQYPVSRLVYEAFIGKIPKGLTVKHKDGNILNNDYQNLYLDYPNASPRVYK